jgi:hypothetical protein
MEERKQILPFVAFFSRHFRVFLFEFFSVIVVGTCHRYYCPSLITALQVSYFHELSARSPHQTITKIQNNINVKTSTVANLKKHYLHFLLQVIVSTTFLSVVLELWIALYIRAALCYSQMAESCVKMGQVTLVRSCVEFHQGNTESSYYCRKQQENTNFLQKRVNCSGVREWIAIRTLISRFCSVVLRRVDMCFVCVCSILKLQF